MIMQATEHSLPWDAVEHYLAELLIAMQRFDCRRAREILDEVVAEYVPAPQIEDLVWSRRGPSQTLPADEPKVTDIAAHRPRQGQLPH
jgi:hypothetical protein